MHGAFQTIVTREVLTASAGNSMQVLHFSDAIANSGDDAPANQQEDKPGQEGQNWGGVRLKRFDQGIKQ